MDAPTQSCPVGGERPLSEGEVALARSVFGGAISYEKVMIRRRKWFPFHPRKVTMAPRGHLHFHPHGQSYCEDFATAALHSQAHFIHEMTHVWQTQTRGDWYLVLHRHPWCRYDYSLKPGWPLTRYGIEQQAEIVKHAFLLRKGAKIPGAAPYETYAGILPFASSS
ncbi:vgr related protein [Alteraurantiacibacter aquimixticola]|uniref:Vgr related protein n=1 Tax=Alteraurantiacibacter aquimixticola TaxID=2489173 RepID=A0A4T3F208_9SPHN|nr:vgr related protein [Alteraurantiacibacter aquimixticola]TIX50080.1 vgr related protein [Alteraurantiacibacter aquimixticola]